MSSNDELSLEQRLVLQLSAAMNQEEEASHQDQHPPANETSTYQEQHLPDTTSHHIDTGDDQININEISNLLNSIGPLGGIAGSQPAMAPTLPQISQPQVSQPRLPAPQTPLHQQPPSLPSNTGTDDSSQSITADALISSLLGGPNSGGLNLANINLNNINLKDISLETLNSISNTLGSNAARYSTNIGNFHLDGLDLPPVDQIGHSASSDHYRTNTGSRSAEQSSSHYSSGQAQNNLSSLIPHDSLTTSSTSGYSRERPREPAFPPTSIDPEVSTIQSVLQSLLTGETNIDQIDGPTNTGAGVANAGSATSNTTGPFALDRPSNSNSLNNDMDFPLLTSLGLGTEDQNLIESLRSAIEGTSSSLASNSTSKPTEPTFMEQARVRLPGPPKPKRSRASTSRSSTFSDASSVSKYSYQSDYNASDPDTLRAIQQALLSALGPSASSTSLAESITQAASDRESGSAAHAGFDHALESSEPQTRVAAAAAAVAGTSHKGATREILSPTSDLSPGSASQSPETSQSTHPLVRISKQRGINKKKLREENAARKRKWREVNLMQNKDNDLRIRIVKRAGELYGEKDTPEKSKWIEEEFTRRRQKRILRAGINSIVESAKARAAKAAEEAGNLPRGSTASSIGYGRFTLENQARTLSQQSKQAAKTHLSQLFRNSNAVLEPQLHSDKLPVPLAPYMLVPSPRRPPYRICKEQLSTEPSAKSERGTDNAEKVLSGDGDTNKDGTVGDSSGTMNKDGPPNESTKSPNGKDSNSATSYDSTASPEASNPLDEAAKVTPRETPQVTEEPPRKPSREPSMEPSTEHTLPKDPSGELQRDSLDDSATLAKQSPSEVSKNLETSPNELVKENEPVLEKELRGTSPKSPKESANESLASGDPPRDNSEISTDSEKLTSSNNTSLATDANYSVFADRPKHRYTLVGSLKLGVPPNLPAIYRQLWSAMRS